MFGNFLAAICIFSLNLFLMTLTGVLRLLPDFLKAARRLLGKFIDQSYRFYRKILEWAAPFPKNHWGIDIQSGWLRLASTNVLSLILGLIIFAVIGLPITIVTVGICVLHGLVVGLVWREKEQPSDEFHLGGDVS
jgi:hypothetical protein